VPILPPESCSTQIVRAQNASSPTKSHSKPFSLKPIRQHVITTQWLTPQYLSAGTSLVGRPPTISHNNKHLRAAPYYLLVSSTGQLKTRPRCPFMAVDQMPQSAGAMPGIWLHRFRNDWFKKMKENCIFCDGDWRPNDLCEISLKANELQRFADQPPS
jgi:hypothetical protein